jgi:predicted DNA-binding transcriptional regulator AlpA
MDVVSPPIADKKTFSIDEFCALHSISRATYFNLRNEGKAPEEMQVGPRRIMISAEAAQDWRRRMTRKVPAATAD